MCESFVYLKVDNPRAGKMTTVRHVHGYCGNNLALTLNVGRPGPSPDSVPLSPSSRLVCSHSHFYFLGPRRRGAERCKNYHYQQGRPRYSSSAINKIAHLINLSNNIFCSLF